MTYEYKVLPAPDRGSKTRGVKGPEGRFAAAMERVLNEVGAQGWEYLRAETLPSEERSGLTQKTTVLRNLLVFRRSVPQPPTQPEAAHVASVTKSAAPPALE